MLVQPEMTVAGGAQRSSDLRSALGARHRELAAEYADAVAEMTLAGVVDAGDDVADLGTKAFSRDQEFALAQSIRSRMEQVERAMERLDEGTYGRCERCAEDIPVARLTAFPSVTSCVRCKSLSERR
ncbi:TraR/DksA family transcriptional regulator [Dactylosporangium sp. NPDC049525]|uniref:TraR/DksA family transcriptional regulator n=1 Tax=Dactylosporangium sp. NPDC049525 TaxID=3154730 RepID=UPI00344892A8